MSELPIELTVQPPYVEIIPLRWGWYRLVLHEPVTWRGMEVERWTVPTARWAKNKAARVLAAHHRRDARENDRWIIE